LRRDGLVDKGVDGVGVERRWSDVDERRLSDEVERRSSHVRGTRVRLRGARVTSTVRAVTMSTRLHIIFPTGRSCACTRPQTKKKTLFCELWCEFKTNSWDVEILRGAGTGPCGHSFRGSDDMSYSLRQPYLPLTRTTLLADLVAAFSHDLTC
jgi:hypothetical protein